MYRILSFKWAREKGWQATGDTIATYATHGEAKAELTRLRGTAPRESMYYRVQCDPSPAMLAVRDALTDCERAMQAIQLADDDSDREFYIRQLVVSAGRLRAASVARLSEIAAFRAAPGKDGR
jgi:hypothetical protein